MSGSITHQCVTLETDDLPETGSSPIKLTAGKYCVELGHLNEEMPDVDELMFWVPGPAKVQDTVW